MAITKIQRRFTDYGCGFPVVLQNVPMVRVRGEWTLDVNYNELHVSILLALASKRSRLIGSEIKFIINYFELTLEEFSKCFDVSRQAVMKWVKAADEPPPIKWSLERDMRLFVMDRLDETSEAIGELYRELRSKPPVTQCSPSIVIDMAG